MHILKNISLKKYNTFGIDVNASHFCEITSVSALIEVLKSAAHSKKFILGGGSNMLLTQDIDALVLYINLKGIQVIAEDGNEVIVEAKAGENWHDFVLWTLSQGYGGLENLSLIPGNTGTAPIQNIGAYGVELKDVMVSCEAVERSSGTTKTFSNAQCKFGYRDSIFKNEAKEKFVITSVRFRLESKNHKLNTSYGAIEGELSKLGISAPSINDISKAVIRIRQSKLPDPKVLGNSGSFFKNPVLSRAEFDQFYTNHPDAPFYELNKNTYKIPAGWLIEKCGFKGKRIGNTGVHEKQALVLVNYGGATGNEVYQLSQRIQEKVKTQFGITIFSEVNIIR